jgi:hypothetical protein
VTIYAVNGKEPIAAWIPSRDDAGNGTTTLTDLVGSNNGTLTSMDAATDWPADTDAGGVRALDFDGVDDYIPTTLAVTGSGALSVSGWFKTSSARTAPENVIMSSAIDTTANALFWLAIENGVFYTRHGGSIAFGSSGLNDSDWHHFVWSKPSGASISGINVYIDGVAITLSPTGSGVLSFSSDQIDIGRREFAPAPNYQWLGRLDDMRVFNLTLDTTDVDDLYAGGLGRGITFGGTVSPRRRRSQQRRYAGL